MKNSLHLKVYNVQDIICELIYVRSKDSPLLIEYLFKEITFLNNLGGIRITPHTVNFQCYSITPVSQEALYTGSLKSKVFEFSFQTKKSTYTSFQKEILIQYYKQYSKEYNFDYLLENYYYHNEYLKYEIMKLKLQN
jgi:hypothetical protein